ncbi:MAG: hypothetical protein L0I76_29280 [Pseudonocardia sp.]|nr:hypothetical protein [Pseudonocardia sp.]
MRDLLATDPDELWVIQINPQRIEKEPRTLTGIADRRNGLAGNLSLYQELGFIETIDGLLADGSLSPDSGYSHVTVRIIEMPAGGLPRFLGPASKMNRDVGFLRGLREQGRAQADRFLAALAFERALVAGDGDALRAATTPDAALSTAPPFPPFAGTGLRGEIAAMTDGRIRIDTTRKQIAGGTATWTVRIPDTGSGSTVTGQAEALFDGPLVRELRLGPGPPH